jgi:hypothetical protein
MDLHPDLRDLFSALAAADAEYLVVGGYAVAFHGCPRFTKDLGLWIGEEPSNLSRVLAALRAFGAPAAALAELQSAGPSDIVWMGAAPVRVEIFRTIPGVEFLAAWERRLHARWASVSVEIIGLEDLLAAKRATAREQDLADVRALERSRKRP